MTRKQPSAAQDERGVAGIEFVVVAPMLLLLIGGLSDFGLASWKRGVLASSVAEGASYAVVAGPVVNTSSVQAIVREKLSLPAGSVTITGPACYCMSGMPAVKADQAWAVKANQVCSSPCPDGKQPGIYITIRAQHTYQPIFPVYANFASPELVETAMARLQ